MKKIVFFDFDGVIVDSFNLVYHLNKLKEADLTADEYRSRFDGNIYKHFDPGKKSDRSLQSQNFLDFFRQYTPGIMPMEYIQGIDDVIKKLSENYTLCVNSSTLASSIRSYLKLHDLEQFFANVMGPETSFDKTEKFKDALRVYNATAQDSLFITDTLGDIREANVIKIPTIGVTWGYHDAQRLQKGDPIAIVNHPADLVVAVEKHFARL